jgi:superfamily II DNA/RNA helicase
MSQSARTKSLASFSSGRADTLVATDVAARGLDVDRVSHVVNFDPPDDDETYVHRVGRTGRAGRTGTGITLVLPDERERVAKMARKAGVEAKCERTRELLAPERAPSSAAFRRAPGRGSGRGRHARG